MKYSEYLQESIGIDYKRLDNLVRSGLLKVSDYPTFKIAIKKLSGGRTNTLTQRESKVVSGAMSKVLSIILDDDTAYQASLLKLRNEDVCIDVDGIQITEEEKTDLLEACGCIEKAKKKMTTNPEEQVTEGEDGSYSPVKRDFTLHFVHKDGKKSWKKESAYSPRGLKQKYAEDDAPDLDDSSRKLVDIKQGGKSVFNEAVEAPTSPYKDHDDVSLKNLHKVLVRPFSVSGGGSMNSTKIKELDDVENELGSRNIGFNSYKEPAGKQLEESKLAMPLKGHTYHSKSDAELRYIQKDAHEAAQAMKNHDPKAESKYLDQVNDASTVLYYRSKGGEQVKPKETITETFFIEADISKYSTYFNIGSVYLSDLDEDSRMKEIKEAFESKDLTFIIEGSFYGEIMNRIYNTRKQGHSIRDVSITSKGGIPHAEFSAVDKEGILRRHVVHGNSSRIENRGIAKTVTGHKIDDDKDTF